MLEINSELDWQFLNEYAQFGVFSHKVVADSLLHSFQATDNLDIKKILRVRLYSEVIASIEDLAGICISIKNRNLLPILTSYLNYGRVITKGVRVENPKAFFKHIRSKSGGGLDEWLSVESQNNELFDLISKKYSSKKSTAENNLIKATQIYLSENQIFVKAYNKAKHGFVVTRGFSSSRPHFPPNDNSVAILYGAAETSGGHGVFKISAATLDIFEGLEQEIEFMDSFISSSIDIINYVVELQKNGCLN